MNRNNMPLTCTICDKKPSFSDISHLLTHISSKQHLSNYFKIQVQSNGDDEAQRHLDRYNAWYEQWDMAELLKERMAQKEKKKSGKNADSAKATARRVSNAPKAQIKISRGSKKAIPTSRDVHHESIKHEPSRMPYTSHQTFSTLSTVGWRENSHFKQEELPSSDADAVGEYDLLDRPRGLRPLKHYRMSDETNDYTSDGPDSADDEMPELKEGIKLKGIIWPGMNLFDAATPEMQRKRNQKKTTDVVAFLEATSRIIEPEEMIYDIDGDFLKQREITGDPDDRGTPLSGETTPEPDSPPTKKKAVRARKSRPVLQTRVETAGEVSRRSQRSHTSFGNKQRAVVQELSDDDDNFTYQSRPKRSGFSIHRDGSGPAITLAQPADGAISYGFTPIENTFAQYSTFSQQYPSLYGPRRSERDLSAFGNLTHGFRPTYNPFSAVESVRYRATQSNVRSPHLPSPQPLGSYESQANLNWIPPQLTAEPNAMLGILDETTAAHPNTMFWNSDHFFGDDKENLPPYRLKQEDDGETISLPSDQK